MAGSKTRFGYLGGGDEPPDAGEPGAARTVIGHDVHLPQLPSGFAPSPTPMKPAPAARARMGMAPFVRAPVPTPMPDAVTDAIPAIPNRRDQRPEKSKLARFLGRWTTGGHFRSSQSMRTSDLSLADLDVPKDTAGRNVLLVLAIAALTFLVTFAVMKWRQSPPPAAAPPAAARIAAPALPPTLPAEPPALPPPLEP